MSLRNRSIQGKSFFHPLSKANLAKPLNDKEKENAIKEKDWNCLIEAHMRLGCSIAGRYVEYDADPDEMVSAAMLGICVAVDRFKKKSSGTDNITGYIVAYIHQYCSEVARRDCVIPPPQKKKPNKTQQLCDIISNDFNITDFDDQLTKVIESDKEALIVDLRRQGYTDETIAALTISSGSASYST